MDKLDQDILNRGSGMNEQSVKYAHDTRWLQLPGRQTLFSLFSDKISLSFLSCRGNLDNCSVSNPLKNNYIRHEITKEKGKLSIYIWGVYRVGFGAEDVKILWV